jgi:predicted RNA-binding protein with PUA-like domain
VGAWLLKTEPAEFSFDDLERAGVEPWDGVRNATALNHLRAARVGDVCVVYHSGSERAVVGLASVETAAYPDPRLDDPKRIVIDVRAGARLARPVRLEELRRDPRFADSVLLRQSRLSVVPLSRAQYEAILELAGS